METVLRAKKGKSNLSTATNFYSSDYHNQKEMITELIPKIVPLYDGTELKINQKLIMNGLATISVRNMRSKEYVIKCISAIIAMSTRLFYTVKPDAALLIENHFSKRLLKPIVPSNQQNKWVDSSITEPEESTLKADKLCVHDVEIKSTLID
ncbi:PREDICTED: uncharacterized protein LOC107167218 [Diuraphis noxia]|uniref:uncharacterized protein LOC107167218 n=1 Tax=Diuraphis noxia TaxID=143948 RepID=UPI0007639185|nr:PREDICTED: uncharacterized protein LOC107167218 [Diuraphis noxia]